MHIKQLAQYQEHVKNFVTENCYVCFNNDHDKEDLMTQRYLHLLGRIILEGALKCS